MLNFIENFLNPTGWAKPLEIGRGSLADVGFFTTVKLD